jgi:hypothetical protein
VNFIFNSNFNLKSYCEVLYASVLVKYFVRVFWRIISCECSSEVLCATALVKYFVLLF